MSAPFLPQDFSGDRLAGALSVEAPEMTAIEMEIQGGEKSDQ